MSSSSPSENNVIGAFDTKNNFGHLLDQVERGEVIVITRHGTPVARLVPYEVSSDRADARLAAQEIRQFRKGNRWSSTAR